MSSHARIYTRKAVSPHPPPTPDMAFMDAGADGDTKATTNSAGLVTAIVLIVIVMVIVAIVLAVTLSKPPPVDYVVTWVDGADAEWRAAVRAAVAAAEPDSLDNNPKAREPPLLPPGTRDELFYNLYGALTHAPWLRKIFIVTQRPHVPAYLHQLPNSHKITVVHHDEFFDPEVTRPTFNSMVIESQITNIKGLAEHFLMANDDFMITKPMSRAHFFGTDGTPQVPLELAEPATRFWAPARTLIAHSARLGLPSQTHIPAHVVMPIRKSHLRTLGAMCAPQVRAFKQVRTSVDFPIHWMTVHTGAIRPMSPSINLKLYRSAQDFLGEPDHHLANMHMVCINGDFDAPGVQEKLVRVLFPQLNH